MTNRLLYTCLLAALLLIVAARPASAVTLSVVTPSELVPPSSMVDVSIVVTGLGGAGAPSMGGFDLTLSYSRPGDLQFVGGSIGDPLLGNQLDLSGSGTSPSGISADAAAGTVSAFAVSFDPVDLLVDQQADSFTLLTLTFVALFRTDLTLTINDLSDASGGLLLADIQNGTVSTVPVPGAALLLLTALGVLGGAAGRRRRGGGAVC